MNPSTLELNLAVLALRNPFLEQAIRNASPDGQWTGLTQSKTSLEIPHFDNGKTAQSLYDPQKEAERLIAHECDGGFTLFAGIASASHIRLFLQRYPHSQCLALEAGPNHLRSLFSLMDFRDILQNPRCHIASLDIDKTLPDVLSHYYHPARDGNFSLVILRPWVEQFSSVFSEGCVREGLARISRDYSVQAHFGKIWFVNFCKNLVLLSRIQTTLPVLNTSRRAIIVAAGPSLDSKIQYLRDNREKICIIATDTAWGALRGYDINPDVFVSIDPQYYSLSHSHIGFISGTWVILDMCANPALAEKALTDGCRLCFVCGGHPLSRLASASLSIPDLDTSSGTVTLAAFQAARALGFIDIQTIGDDYAYVAGKPYAKGTYLSNVFDSSSTRYATAETMWTTLMFRTPVRRELLPAGTYTYYSEVMDQYKTISKNLGPSVPWKSNPLISESMIRLFLEDLVTGFKAIGTQTRESERYFSAFLPFLAWYRKIHGDEGENTRKNAIHLALRLIARYTGTS